MKRQPDPGYWKVKTFTPDVDHDLLYDPGQIEFTHDRFPHKIRKPNTWLKAEGAYAEQKPPTILDIWKILESEVECQYLLFENWVIKREYQCFEYKLMRIDNDIPKAIYTNIMGDDLASSIHFIEFISMLREKESEVTEDKTIKLIDYKKNKEEAVRRMIKSLDSVLRE